MENTSNTYIYVKRAIITGGSAGIGLETAKNSMPMALISLCVPGIRKILIEQNTVLGNYLLRRRSQEVKVIQADFLKKVMSIALLLKFLLQVGPSMCSSTMQVFSSRRPCRRKIFKPCAI